MPTLSLVVGIGIIPAVVGILFCLGVRRFALPNVPDNLRNYSYVVGGVLAWVLYPYVVMMIFAVMQWPVIESDVIVKVFSTCFVLLGYVLTDLILTVFLRRFV